MMQIAGTKTVTSQAPWICAVALGLSALSMSLFAADADKSQNTSKLPPAAKVAIEFVKDVQPILERHCYSCHGPKKQESGLRLDDAELDLKGGDMGPAYIPGKSATSALVQYSAGVDENIIMPPDDSNVQRLTANE